MSDRFDFPTLILAAGAATRMRGRDKTLEQVDGRPLIQLQTERALSACSAQVIIALPPAPHPRHKAVTGLDVAIVAVQDAKEGMAASLRAGIAALPSNTEHVMVTLADMPELTAENLRRVGTSVHQNPNALVWRGATSDGTPGHPIVFHRSLFPQLLALQGDTGGKEVITRVKDRVHLVPLENTRARLDLDTPEAWEAWRLARMYDI